MDFTSQGDGWSGKQEALSSLTRLEELQIAEKIKFYKRRALHYI
jgi:hypothetical protein